LTARFEAREQPSDGGDLCGSGQIPPGASCRLKALLVVIANGPYYGTGFTVAPDAIIDDGLLTISVFRDFSKWN